MSLELIGGIYTTLAEIMKHHLHKEILFYSTTKIKLGFIVLQVSLELCC